ncbi:MAG: 4-amino-4-deoxy-L-arabinose transferase, partial [Patescibacteria group bacterium]
MNRKYLIVLSCTFFLAAFLRFYKLGQIPSSLDWDEVSLAYNAQSILQTGKDEFGHSWPLSIQSFSDYKPPVYTYL